ncbi:hypothetical protein PVK06_034594 [Gossypium arboreum]|uniref:Uncharacterized protein n=1 Tax=Gossypium arboreum TaxID=29729 RepID=A0ABR0NEN9_GOSAR|nr:hypothetical protein PVK06_034594 [Gossypium arboreum]
MEMIMQRVNIREDEETTMVRFADGLNVSIANALNLQTYIDLENMVHKAIEIEQPFQQHQSNPFGTSHYYQAKDSRMNLLEECGNDASLKAQFQTHELMGSHYLKAQ